MGIHAIDAFVPGVRPADGESRLEQAIARAGREVVARHDSRVPWREGALHWELVDLLYGRGHALRLSEVGGERLDARLLRSLSAVCGGFVIGLESYGSIERYRLAAMFAGRTIELALWDTAGGCQGIGYPSHYELLPGFVATNKYSEHVQLLCNLNQSDHPWPVGRVVRAGEWELSPPLDGYSVEDEKPITHALFARIEESRFRATLPQLGVSGWRWRARPSPVAAQPLVELTRGGALDGAQVATWGRLLGCPYLGFEVPGRGGAIRTIEGEGDTVKLGQERERAGIDRLAATIGEFGVYLGESACTLFDGDGSGWNEAT